MDTPHDPRYDSIEDKVEKLFLKYDLAYYAFMNMVLDSTHSEIDDGMKTND